MKSLLAFLVLLCASPQFAQKVDNTEQRLERLSQELEYAVLPVVDWGGPKNTKIMPVVIGTAFLLNEDGYFVTAAHVLENYVPKSARVVVVLRQRGGGDAWFDIVRHSASHQH